MILVSLALGLAGCSAKSEAAPQAPEAPLALPVAAPTVADRAIEREYVAEIRAIRHAEVRSRIKGIIESVAVDEGRPVKAGDKLFSIDARSLRQEVLAARAASKTAEAELMAGQTERQNSQGLLDKNIVSKAEIAMLDAKVNSLKAKVDEAKAGARRVAAELDYATLKAPFAGVVNRIPHRVGSAIGEGELLTTITDTSEVHAYFRVTEREFLEYTAASGQAPREVSLRLADGRAFPVAGVVDAVESEFDKETGNIAFRAKFSNPTGLLRHGSSGKVVLRTEVRGALLVPQSSTFEVQGNLFVYALDADSIARARKITARARIEGWFVVESGLSQGDRFVLEGAQKIKDGSRVEPLAAGPSQQVK